NIAARLEALAKPGTICVSDGVYRHVRDKRDELFIDLGRKQLKHISDPVHAYLIVPREHAAAHQPRGRRRRLWVASAALLLLAAAAALYLYRRINTPIVPPGPQVKSARQTAVPVAESGQPVQQLALGVMAFRNRGGSGGGDWRCEALRDGLNTQLSRLSHVKVYSKEFIDFLITRKGLTEIEAASQLGIGKMLSGSFVTVGGSVRIETHIVDVASGVLESSYTTTGSERDFPDLQNKLTVGVGARLNLPVTAEEQKTLLAQGNTNVEAMQMLLEAEGGAPSKPAEPPSKPAAGPQSSLPQWLALRPLRIAAA